MDGVTLSVKYGKVFVVGALLGGVAVNHQLYQITGELRRGYLTPLLILACLLVDNKYAYLLFSCVGAMLFGIDDISWLMLFIIAILRTQGQERVAFSVIQLLVVIGMWIIASPDHIILGLYQYIVACMCIVYMFFRNANN